MIPIILGKTCPISPSSYSIQFQIKFPTASECVQKWSLRYLLFSLQDTDSHSRRLHSNNRWKNELQEGEQSTSQIQNRSLSNRYQESSRDHQRELLAASRAYESLGSLYGQAALPGEWFSKDLHCKCVVSSVRCPLPMYLKWPCNIQYKKKKAWMQGHISGEITDRVWKAQKVNEMYLAHTLYFACYCDFAKTKRKTVIW